MTTKKVTKKAPRRRAAKKVAKKPDRRVDTFAYCDVDEHGATKDPVLIEECVSISNEILGLLRDYFDDMSYTSTFDTWTATGVCLTTMGTCSSHRVCAHVAVCNNDGSYLLEGTILDPADIVYALEDDSDPDVPGTLNEQISEHASGQVCGTCEWEARSAILELHKRLCAGLVSIRKTLDGMKIVEADGLGLVPGVKLRIRGSVYKISSSPVE